MPFHQSPEMLSSNPIKASGLMFILVVSVFTLGMGTHRSAPRAPLTLEALYSVCGLPLSCGAPVACEGTTVRVRGRLDPHNVFDHQHYPQLPYEKFRLVDEAGRSLEVWPQADDNRPVFAKLARRPSDRVVVEGRLAVVKMPTAAACRIGLKMVITHADQIEFSSEP